MNKCDKMGQAASAACPILSHCSIGMDNPPSSLWHAFFAPTPPRRYRWLPWAWTGILFVCGILFWGIFLHWGAIPFDFHDWAEVNAARIAFVRQALLQGELPLQMSSDAFLRSLTDRYFVLPDVISSPQMVLLGIMQTGPFILVNTLLLYGIGMGGLLWLRRRFNLSSAAFTLLFLVYNFNGYIQAHLSVGHVTWGGYFLFSWLLVFAIQLLDRPQGWRWTAGVAALLFFMVLNGSFHQFVWSLYFLGLLGIAAYRRFFTVLRALAFGGLLSAVRLLPPALGLGEFSNEFISGYPNPGSLVDGLIRLVTPAQAYQTRLNYHGLGFWELDLYVGLAGAVLLLVFGGYAWVRNLLRGKQYPQLVLPAVVLGVFSLYVFYKPVMFVPFPLITAERVSSRMVILPFLLVSLWAAVNLQGFFNQGMGQKWWARGTVIAALAILGYDLYQHLLAWQVTQAAQAFPPTPVNLNQNLVGGYPDPIYTNLLIVGSAVTLLTAVFLAWMAWREHQIVRKEPHQEQSRTQQYSQIH